MKYELNLSAPRARMARAAEELSKAGAKGLAITAFVPLLLGSAIAISGPSRLGLLLVALGLVQTMLYFWYVRKLQHLSPSTAPKSLADILEPKLLAAFGKKAPATVGELYQLAVKQWQGAFILSHLLIYPDLLAQTLSSGELTLEMVWQKADDLRRSEASTELDAAAIITSMLIASPVAKKYLAKNNLSEKDVVETFSWQTRLAKFMNEPKPYFGGVGRDWAAGFTPTLDQFGENISREIELGQGHFHTIAHADILDPIIASLKKQNGVAVLGELGAGKTSVVYALAERLLSGRDPDLLYFQVFKLNASEIISAAGNNLERGMLALFAEAIHARNIIIFLDEAQLFFGEGTGKFDISQILLPILQNHGLKIITTFTPDDFQSLKNKNASLANLLSTINITQPDDATIMKITEDSALTFEAREKLLISFQAVKEAYRLSDQYLQDQAYPGKAISLLEQSLVYAQDKIVSAESVQLAVEKTRGVKVTKAQGPETDTLLHLEDKIHARMINQQRAVEVVSSALRRGRVGISDPRRPIGSFLFLGPTGVGKTELARSLAAVYFGDERQVIRLDMSEYQQTADIDRLLDPGGDKDRSLILKIREQPFAVVLLDEIEKAHPNVLNLLLQMLDEGQLTDRGGKPTSFKNAIIIATSNAGSAEISQRVAHGDNLQDFERPLIDELIANGLFKAELVNRFDEIVLFRPLKMDELAQVAQLMLAEVNKNLSKQNIVVKLTQNALNKVVQAGYDPKFGARPMRRVIQEMVEDAVADKILKKTAQPGSIITLDAKDLAESNKD